MSRFYNYDIFLSCAYEDKDSAVLLRRKLRELDFHSWFEVPEIEEKNVFIEEMWEAIEDSAVCILLVGSGGTFPWVDGSVWSAINCRLERPDSVFRVITVILPQANSNSSVTFPWVNNTRLVSSRPQSTIVRFNQSLDEKDVLTELVLRIRGVDPDDQSYFSDDLFREQMQLRALNALNVDWYQLVSDLRSRPCDSITQHEEVGRRSGKADRIDSWKEGWNHPLPICYEGAPRFSKYPNSTKVFKSDLPEKIALSEVPKNRADQNWRKVFSGSLPGGLIKASNLNSRNAMAAVALLLMIGVSGYWSWNHFLPSKEVALVVGPSNEVNHVQIETIVEGAPDGRSKVAVETRVEGSPEGDTRSKVREKRKPPKSVTVRHQASELSPEWEWRDRVADFVESIDHASYRQTASQPRRTPDDFVPYKRVVGKGRAGFASVFNPKTTKGSQRKRSADILLSSDDIGGDPVAQNVPADQSLKSPPSGRSRVLHLGGFEVKISQWKRSYRIKLAGMKRIYVEVSNNTALDEKSKALLVAGFIRPLEEKGIEVFTSEDDRHRADGIASLQFGPKEMRSGSVAVDLKDNNNQNMNSWVTPTVCELPDKERLRTGLCNASEQLGDKLVSAIRDASDHVDKQRPDSGTTGEVRNLKLK